MPWLEITGTAFRTTRRNGSHPQSAVGTRSPRRRFTSGSWTASWSTLPASVDHARTWISDSQPAHSPTKRPPIWARFQSTGAAKGRKNRRWLLSTPRLQAATIITPAIGKRMRTSDVASSASDPLQPGTITRVRSGARRTPRALRTPASPTTTPATARARRRAFSSSRSRSEL